MYYCALYSPLFCCPSSLWVLLHTFRCFDTRCRPQQMEHKNSEMSNCWLLVAVALLCVERVKSEYLFKAPIYLRGGVGKKMGTDRVFSPAEAQGGKQIDPQSTAVVLIEFQVCRTTTQRHTEARPPHTCTLAYSHTPHAQHITRTNTPSRTRTPSHTERVLRGGWQAARCSQGSDGQHQNVAK